MNRKFCINVSICLLVNSLFFFSLSSAEDNSPAAQEILLKSDEVRNPQLDYVTWVKVTSFKPNREPTIATYDVMVKGREKAVVKTLSPAVDKGRILLMLGNDLWAFLPEVSKPLRISLQERLIGDVANGDIARTNFSGDYTPELTKSEKIEGRDYYVLKLAAKTESVTYASATLWIDKENFHPFKAEFFAVSGRLLKTCSYENYRELAGRLRPTRLVMNDPVVKGKKSVIEYDSMKVKELPEKYFAKDYMKKLMD